MIKFLTEVYERMFNINQQPQLTNECLPETSKKRKKVDNTTLTSAQVSLIRDALLANAKANLSGYGKTNKELGEDFNRIFGMSKSKSAWNRIFKKVMTEQPVGE